MVVLQRGVEDFFDHRGQAVNLVDEEHIVFFQVGQQRCQVLGLFKHRTAGLAQVHAQLVGHDVAERGLAQAGRAKQQHMVQGLAPLAGRTYENFKLLARLGLAHVLVEQLGAQGALQRLFFGRVGRGRHDALGRRRKVVGLDAHGGSS